MLNDPNKNYGVWYVINADHVTIVYFTDWSVDCKKMEVFNVEEHRSLFRFSNMILLHEKK